MAKLALPVATKKKQKPIPVKIVSDTACSPKLYDDTKYRAEEGLRTLARAEEIRKDKHLMKEIKAQAKSLAKAVCK